MDLDATDDIVHGRQLGRFCRLGLAGTAMAEAQCQTIRLKL